MDFELNCPPAVEANQEFACLIKVHQGSNMHLEAHFTGGNAVATPIDGKMGSGCFLVTPFKIKHKSARTQVFFYDKS